MGRRVSDPLPRTSGPQVRALGRGLTDTLTGDNMTATTTTIRVTTAAGARASEVGAAHVGAAGSWRNSVDRCDSDGGGRVFRDVPADHVEWTCASLKVDPQVTHYKVM